MFLPENIDLGKSEKYILTIRLKRNGFSFSIHDPNDRSCYCFRETIFSRQISLLNNVQRIIFDYNFLTEAFKQTNVIVASKDYDIIPSEYYQKKKATDLYNFTHTKNASHVLTASEAIEGNSLLFAFDEEMHSFLMRSLYNPTFKHHIGLIANYLRKYHYHCKVNRMYLNFHEDFVDIICFNKNSDFLFANTYHKEHDQDILYYSLSIWENSGFNQRNDLLFICGDQNEYLFGTLKEYIKNIEKFNIAEILNQYGERGANTPADMLTIL